MRIVLALLAMLVVATPAYAWKPVPNGAAIDLSYTEPDKNTDGSLLTDLAKIRAYWKCVAVSGAPPCPVAESIVDIPATRLQGGGVIVNNNSVIMPVKCQQSATFTIQVTALDNATPANESPRSMVASGTVNRAAEACPPTVPQTPSGIGAQ